jgi:two-component system sensor histidine kinase DesK
VTPSGSDEPLPLQPTLFESVQWPDEGAEPDERGAWARGWRRIVFPGIFLVYLLQTVGAVADHSDGAAEIVGYVLVGLFCVVYLATLVALYGASSRRFWWGFGLLVAISVAEMFFAHEGAFTMFVYIGVLAIALLDRRAVPIVAVLVAVALFLPPLIPAWHAGVDIDDGFSIAIILLAMFAFFGLMRANIALTHARAAIAGLAAENERNRIARDLHDILGHSLTSITLKAGLARRLTASDPQQAAVEIGEVEELSRHALSDVRAAVVGYREVRLSGELATGRDLLRTLGLTADFPPSAADVDARYQELFGWVLREALTNVVRHSHAQVCTVRVGVDWMEVVDDGVGSWTLPGSGLSGLGERVRAAGGELSAGPVIPIGWRLRVDMGTLPAAPAATPSDDGSVRAG